MIFNFNKKKYYKKMDIILQVKKKKKRNLIALWKIKIILMKKI